MTTAKQITDWLKANQGRAYDFDGRYSVQCMDLVNQITVMFFNQNITAGHMYPPSVWAGKLPSGWTKHTESQPGDIFITRACGHSPVGHIGFIAEDNQHIFDQNGTSQNDPITYRNGLDGIYLGFIRPPYEQQVRESKPVLNKGVDKMSCLVICKDNLGAPFLKNRVFYWSADAGFKYLEDPDDIKILDEIAKHTIGKAMFRVESTKGAPWHYRLAQVNGMCDIK